MGRTRSVWLFLGLVLLAVSFNDATADVIPSENECRPYIEKAIHELKNTDSTATENDSIEDKTGEDASIETMSETIIESSDEKESVENAISEDNSQEQPEEEASKEDSVMESAEQITPDGDENKSEEEIKVDEPEQESDSKETGEVNELAEPTDDVDSKEVKDSVEEDSDKDSKEVTDDGNEENSKENSTTEEDVNNSTEEPVEIIDEASSADASKEEESNKQESVEELDNTIENVESKETENESVEEKQTEEENSTKEDQAEEANDTNEEANDTKEEANDTNEEVNDTNEEANDTKEDLATDENEESGEEKTRSKRSISDEQSSEKDTQEDTVEEEVNDITGEEANDSKITSEETSTTESQEQEIKNVDASKETETEPQPLEQTSIDENSKETAEEIDAKSEEERMPEEDLTIDFEIPKNLRNRDHISDLLGLDAESSIKENALKRTSDVVLKELKRIYDNAIKPLESMYKYRDLSNRHYGDPEIFSKPLIVFMGPYSGGKSTILNYLTDNEYTPNSIRSGAEPSPAYFNILMHGDETEVLDGTQLAADWTFSGLQKFGQGLMDRLRGQKLPSKLLERVNIVEIPGILEVRKQVSRYFPFNDACQWFIDRADIIFLVYDPSKLDVGPETEAILDQLKGREYQTRILLNKGDQVKPEELLRVQSALIWNISPLMSSAQPPVMYTVSLWSHPFEHGSPTRLLQAQERAMLGDLREAIDKRIENKIASARRFAVRIRNHAKMVDCYLTTYYNQKTLFSNKKHVSDKIIEHPQNYNIYEGLSTLTNISRYDLPDPEVYLDFFRLNPLYEFKKLSETCTYFKGCPINKLDIAIAYDLPELVGRYKKILDESYTKLRREFDENCNQSSIEPPVKLNSR